MSQIDDLYSKQHGYSFTNDPVFGNMSFPDNYTLRERVEEMIRSGSKESEAILRSGQRDISSYISALGSPSGITDRSQIINPDDIIASRYYSSSEAGQAKMQQDLNALRTYASQQEAAYLEYYNSPEQQKQRDREAGLNTDLLGLSGSQGTQSQQVTSNPNEGIMSDEELRSQKIQNASNLMSGISSIVSAAASVCQLPAIFKGMKLTDSHIGLNNAQAAAINVGAAGSMLGNISQFEKLAGGEISSRLSDAVGAALSAGKGGLDISSWFADDNNFSGILDTYAPDSSPQYAGSFANLRKRMQQSLGSAYEQGKITAENQTNFSRIAADPSYSSDQLTQIALLRPYMVANAKAELARLELDATLSDWNKRYQSALSVDSAVDAANQKNKYDAKFWEDMDAELQAAFENYKTTCEQLAMSFDQKINQNLLDIYTQNMDNERGFSAAYLFRSGASASLSDYFYSNNMTAFSSMLENQRSLIKQQSELYQFEHKFIPLSNISWNRGSALSYIFGGKSAQKNFENYIKTLQGIAGTE